MTALVIAFWIADSLTKVLPGMPPPENPVMAISLTCARNEYEAAQIVLHAPGDVEAVSATPSDLRMKEGSGVINAAHVRCRFVDYIALNRNTFFTPDEELVGKAPIEIPDILRETPAQSLKANRNQPVWVTVYVPETAIPGTYEGTIAIEGAGQTLSVPVSVRVPDFTVPKDRHLYVTQWFTDNPIYEAANGNEEAFFAGVKAYAENMASHRQNVFWVNISRIQVFREADGALTFDYANFDRYVQAFIDAGAGDRIEIQQIGHQGEGGWDSHEIVLGGISATDRATGSSVALGAEDGLGPLLEDLQRHLSERGWLDRTMIHIADEPQLFNVDSFKEAAAFVHAHAPGIKRIEAIEARDFTGALEVWVPKLSHLRNWAPFYEKARQPGNELWYYICCHPTGRYLNRFLDYPPLKNRLLHWVNYRYGLEGFLHWGFNFWVEDPFVLPQEELPPGDRNIVYPGPVMDGHATLLDSTRWEVQRDSIEDFEYLWLLEQGAKQVAAQLGEGAEGLNPRARSQELCGRMVRSFMDYERDPARFHAVRATLTNEIETMRQEPLVLWETMPGEDLPVEPGPTAIEIQGVTHPGAKVTINGTEAEVLPSGRFIGRVQFWDPSGEIQMHVEYQGKVKDQVRVFLPES